MLRASATRAAALSGGVGAVGTAPDTLIVRFRASASRSARSAAHLATRSTALRSFDLIPAEVVRLAPGADRDAVMAAYRSRRDVTDVQPNFVYQVAAAPNDRLFARQWGLRNLGQDNGTAGADIDAVAAWDIATGDDAVVVGVIDTGIDPDHPDLRDNMWTNELERLGIPGVDDDGNGIADDVYGARWIDSAGQPTDGNSFDDHFHGTHVAGIIGAAGNNAEGVAGINHRVRLMALKFINHQGFGYTADAIAAIEYGVAMGAMLTNNSWGGGDFDPALRDAIEAAGEAGQLFVAAAGNDANDNDLEPFYPAAHENESLVAVACTTRDDVLSDFSNYGVSSVDIAAPGSDIISTFPGSGYRTFSGTSMAAPHVTGVAALLLAHLPGARPDEIKQLLLDGAEHVPALDGSVAGGRRLNALNALTLAAPGTGRVSFDRTGFACWGWAFGYAMRIWPTPVLPLSWYRGLAAISKRCSSSKPMSRAFSAEWLPRARTVSWLRTGK